MGFVRNKVFKLIFADPEYQGLEVRVRSASIRQMLRFSDLKDAATEREKADQLIDLMLSGVVSWNVETEGGQAVPLSADALWDQGLDFLIDISREWMNASAGVSPPLAQPSSAGEPSLEASIPMDVLSPNPPTSPTPN